MTSEEYLRGVGSALRDLPWQQRQDLLAELRGHLADFPADTDLVGRLGTPEQYAADLRATEGLERGRGPLAYVRARRPRTVIATALALTLVGLVSGGFAWVHSYQPLANDGGGFLPTQVKQAPNGAYEPLEFRRGGHFRFGVPIGNNGPFGVRILGLGGVQADPVTLLPHPPLPFAIKLMMIGPLAEWADERGPVKPFHPFDLAPGHAFELIVQGTYAKTCRPWAPGEIAVFAAAGFYPFEGEGALPIRFHFLWKTSTALIHPVAYLLQIRFPKGCR